MDRLLTCKTPISQPTCISKSFKIIILCNKVIIIFVNWTKWRKLLFHIKMVYGYNIYLFKNSTKVNGPSLLGSSAAYWFYESIRFIFTNNFINYISFLNFQVRNLRRKIYIYHATLWWIKEHPVFMFAFVTFLFPPETA